MRPQEQMNPQAFGQVPPGLELQRALSRPERRMWLQQELKPLEPVQLAL